MRLNSALAAGFAAIMLTVPATASAQLGTFNTQVNRITGPAQRTPAARPRFVVEAVRFRAHDETGPDWGGSDEVYAVFEDRNNGQRRFTRTFGDVDTGEQRNFVNQESCIGPLDYAGYDSSYRPPASWECRAPGEAGGLDFSIILYEEDGWSPIACAVTPNQQAYKKNCDDNAIAVYEYQFTAARLLGFMPNVGDLREITTPTRGGYDLTFRMRRLADARDPPPVLQ